MYLIVRLFAVIFSVIIASALENGYFEMGASTGGQALSESVKAMLHDGFSQQEIIKSIKSELGLKRINAYVSKMYDGVELTDDEIATMKSGEVEDSDEELANVLEEFERLIEGQLNNNTSVDSNNGNSNFQSDKDIVKELFRENEDSSDESSETSGDNTVPLPKPDYAFSPYDLVRLVKTEEAMYKPLKKYIKKMENKLQILKSYAKNYEDTTNTITHTLGAKSSFEEKAMAIVSNPLSSYKLIRRFAFQLPEVWKAVGDDMEEDLWKELSQVRMKHLPPNDQDWKDAIEALFRIQYYNGYNAKQFAKGELGSIKSNITLSAEECLEIGIRAMAVKKHDFALEWLYLARSKGLNEEHTSEVDMSFVEQTLKYAINEHNKAWDQDNRITAKSHVFTKKLISPVHIEQAKKKSYELREVSKQFRSQEEYDYPIPYNFVSLCSGENLQTEKEKSHLKCWLDRSKDPYFYINPLKIELLSADPYLIQVYDVIGDKMISHVKKIAVSKLQRSQVVNYNDPDADDVSLVRTSSQTWIPQWHPDMGLQNLTKLIEKITGLTTMKHGSSEDFQVACYGFSNHYDEHLDAVQDARRTAEFGERIATLMLYLSTVEEGGKTAFPVLGVAANPVKGSAVFWYNLKKNGQPDKRTWHGGCPVVHGVKWVMNNWILYNENFKNRLCSKIPEE